MADHIAFYETAAQVIPVLLLTEGVRIALSLRDVRDFKEIELEQDEQQRRVTEMAVLTATLRFGIAGLGETVKSGDTEMSASETSKFENLKAASEDWERKSAEAQQAHDDHRKRMDELRPRIQRIEAEAVLANSFTVLWEVIGLLVCLLVIHFPKAEMSVTFAIVFGSISIGVTRVAQELLQPAIENPVGWRQRLTNWIIRQSINLVTLIFILAVVADTVVRLL